MENYEKTNMMYDSSPYQEIPDSQQSHYKESDGYYNG